jgi:hypothetical protein
LTRCKTIVQIAAIEITIVLLFRYRAARSRTAAEKTLRIPAQRFKNNPPRSGNIRNPACLAGCMSCRNDISTSR